MTQFRAVVTYIRLLFLPINQNLDYDYPIYNLFWNPNVFLSFLFLLSIFALGVYLFYRSRFTIDEGRQTLDDSSLLLRPSSLVLRLVSFGIFWFFITLSTESSIIPIVDILFEHRIYLPSVGAIIAFTAAIFYVLHSKVFRSQISNSRFPLLTSHFLLAAIVIALSIAACQRNTVWQDEIRLWENTAKKSPNKARVHYNLGIAYIAKGLTNKAIEHYRIALTLEPDFAEAYNSLGAAYCDKGWIDKAIEYYQLALILKPDFAAVYYNLGNAYYAKGLTDKAREHYNTALRLNPNLQRNPF